MILDHLPSILATAANAHAIAVVLGVRRPAPASTLRRLATRCWLSVLALVGLTVLLFVWTLRQGFGATDPSQKATRLANGISEAVNCTAFAFMASLLPCAVGVWLLWKARRAP